MNERTHKSGEEIDLLYFFKPLTKGVQTIGDALKKYLRILANNKILFFSIVILITAAGYSARYFMGQSYKTEGIFVSRQLPIEYCSLMVKNIRELLSSGKNKASAAEQMNISHDAVEMIYSMSLTSLPNTFPRRDSSLAPFTITLVVGSMQYVDTIQKGILYYLENGDYSRKRRDSRLLGLRQVKQDLIEKIASLDSLKKIVNSSIMPRSQGTGIILGEPIDPVSIYEAEKNYRYEVIRIDQDLATPDNMEVIQPFLKRSTYNYPDFTLILIASFLASLILALFLTPLFGRK